MKKSSSQMIENCLILRERVKKFVGKRREYQVVLFFGRTLARMSLMEYICSIIKPSKCHHKQWTIKKGVGGGVLKLLHEQ